jgi:hypothetical protein
MSTDWDAKHKTLALRAAGATLGLWVIVLTVVAASTQSLRSMMAASMSYGICATLLGLALLAMGGARAAVPVRVETRDSGNRSR